MKKYLDLEGLQSYDHKMKDYIEEYVEDTILHNELGYVSEQEVFTNPQYLPNTGDGFINEIEIYGKTVQSGTPTPESPATINSVAYNTIITSCGKNLFDWHYMVDALKAGYPSGAGEEIVEGFDCFWTMNGFPGIENINLTGINYKPNTRYTISFIAKNITPYNNVLKVLYTDNTIENFPAMPNTGAWTTVNFVSAVGKTVKKVYQEFNSFSKGTYYRKGSFIVSEGNQVIDFVPYISSTTNLNLIGAPNAPADWVGKPISLMSLPDGTADEYRADEGVVIKRIEKEILNGGVSETYLRASYATYDRGDYKIFMYRKTGYLKYKTPIISSHFESTSFEIGAYLYANCIFQYGENRTSYGFPIKIDRNLLSIDWDNSTDEQRITAFRTWLASNNVEVVYALNESITIPVIQQPKINSYAGGTHLYTSLELPDVNPDLWTKEFHDSEIGKDVLLKNKNGETLNPITNAGAVLFKDGYDLEEVAEQLESRIDAKQDKLIAGENITIAGNTISATQPDISTKQDKLTAGDNITIENNVISASGGGEEWDDVTLLNPSTTEYHFSADLDGISIGDTLRITVEMVEKGAGPPMKAHGERIFIVKILTGYPLFFPTFTIMDNAEFFGRIEVGPMSTAYNYDLDMTNYYKPNIVKIERKVN